MKNKLSLRELTCPSDCKLSKSQKILLDFPETIKASPLSFVSSIRTQYNSLYQTQPQTARNNDCKYSVFQIDKDSFHNQKDCQIRNCLFNKLKIAELQQKVNKIQEQKEVYRSKYLQEKQRVRFIFQQVEETVNAIQIKESLLKQKEIELTTNTLGLQTQSVIIQKYKEEFKELEEEIKERIQQYQLEETILRKQKNQLQNQITQKELNRRLIIESNEILSTQEKELMQRISNLNKVLKYSEKHFQNLNDLEKLLSDRCKSLENIQNSLIVKCEENSYQEMQLQLKNLCHSMNEEAFSKKIETQTERFLTTRQTSPLLNKHKNKVSRFFKSQAKNENQIYSTIQSKDNSQKEDSFKLYRPNIKNEQEISFEEQKICEAQNFQNVNIFGMR